MPVDLKEVRRRAWATRRRKYGPQGHAGSYGRGVRVIGRIKRMEDALILLYDDAVLSEGQVAKITGIDRITIRTRADELRGKSLRDIYNA